MKPILSIDFDGVIHSYDSGWKGAHIIPDAPVPGALEALVRYMNAGFDVAIFSARSKSLRGRWAMKRWLRKWLIALGEDRRQEEDDPQTIPEWWSEEVCRHSAMEPWYVSVEEAADRIVGQIKWPWFKPSALMTIDDRALTFNGDWSHPDWQPDALRAFKPWNKKPRPEAAGSLSESIRRARGGDAPVQTRGYA